MDVKIRLQSRSAASMVKVSACCSVRCQRPPRQRILSSAACSTDELHPGLFHVNAAVELLHSSYDTFSAEPSHCIQVLAGRDDNCVHCTHFLMIYCSLFPVRSRISAPRKSTLAFLHPIDALVPDTPSSLQPIT
jgi:hypothetical protein